MAHHVSNFMQTFLGRHQHQHQQGSSSFPGINQAQAQAQVPQICLPRGHIPTLPDLFVLDKSQWCISDRAYFERDAITGQADTILTLANVAYTANTMNADPASPDFGRHNCRYRQGPTASNNARRMEVVSVLSWAYTLDKSWNPYYRHPILGQRLEAALSFWLRLQTKEGGLSENGEKGSMALAPTAFSFELLVDMWDKLDQDGTFNPELRDHLRIAVPKAGNLCATDKGFYSWGYEKSNQYSPAFYILWRLYEITKDIRWKQLYNERLDDWLKNAQTALFWSEIYGPENFSYSHVTEWELDRVYALNKDPRIYESFRKYFEWCSLNTLPENDGLTFITDTVGHTRTTRNAPTGQVGFFNHITQDLVESRPFAFAFMMTEQEREEKIQAWLQNPIAPVNVSRAKLPTYTVFHSYPMSFSPMALWTVTLEQQQDAVSKMLPLAIPFFTRYFKPVGKEAQYLFARRASHYTTLHFGRSISHQHKEIGLIWLPGFGTLIRSTNEKMEAAYCTRIGDKSTFKHEISDFRLPNCFQRGEPNGAVRGSDYDFTTNFGGMGITKTFRIRNDKMEVSVTVNREGVEQIPIYLDKGDVVLIDGVQVDLRSAKGFSVQQGIRIRRSCGGIVGEATLGFDRPVEGSVVKGYPIAKGEVIVLAVSLKADVPLTWAVWK